MSFKPALLGHNETRWSMNGLTFATEEEAKSSAWNTFFNCTHFDEYKAIESDEPVTHRWDAVRGAVNLEDEAKELGRIILITPPEHLTEEE